MQKKKRGSEKVGFANIDNLQINDAFGCGDFPQK